ncbi:predicted protein [Plenodomus lingam JN3]|uniref:Predicted protein n=1 Tax=Leptosphaeria maculans (strain JN3 / isolate v23.1.3 / race Av1-4-5-6-7-8) TaxID=985895 RepID=E5A8B7_LEPMJ|nr:predicted protein [Plenodomus lingam JN3]CBX99862.1 predicted protein [Plenodomus lingam JN3]
METNLGRVKVPFFRLLAGICYAFAGNSHASGIPGSGQSAQRRRLRHNAERIMTLPTGRELARQSTTAPGMTYEYGNPGQSHLSLISDSCGVLRSFTSQSLSPAGPGHCMIWMRRLESTWDHGRLVINLPYLSYPMTCRLRVCGSYV